MFFKKHTKDEAIEILIDRIYQVLSLEPWKSNGLIFLEFGCFAIHCVDRLTQAKGGWFKTSDFFDLLTERFLISYVKSIEETPEVLEFAHSVFKNRQHIYGNCKGFSGMGLGNVSYVYGVYERKVIEDIDLDFDGVEDFLIGKRKVRPEEIELFPDPMESLQSSIKALEIIKNLELDRVIKKTKL